MDHDVNTARRRHLLGAAAVAATGGTALALAPGAASAQAASWPNKPIRFIVPYPAGGGADIVARLAGAKMSAALGQTVVIDNKPGASTIIGTEALAKAPPDGYTIGMVTDSFAVNPSLFPSLPYDTNRDFEPIGQLIFINFMLVATPKLQVSTLGELIAKAKANPQLVNYASVGNGSLHQVLVEWLKLVSGTNMTHIPYSGVAPALADLVAGQVDVMFSGTSSALPYAKAGRLVPLAVASARRLPSVPEVPTVSETYPEFELTSWYGLAAPARTPPDIVARLNREMVAAQNDPEVRAKLAALDVIPAPSSAGDFGAFIKHEAVKLTKIVKSTGVKIDKA